MRKYAAPCPTLSFEDRCQLKPITAIFVGAGFGALLRWRFGLTLNSYFPSIPPGTLAANLIGGYIIGVAMAFFSTSTALAPVWRPFVITGFCGGLSGVAPALPAKPRLSIRTVVTPRAAKTSARRR